MVDNRICISFPSLENVKVCFRENLNTHCLESIEFKVRNLNEDECKNCQITIIKNKKTFKNKEIVESVKDFLESGKIIDTKRNELQTYLWLELITGLYLFMLLIIFPLLSSFHKTLFLYIGDQIFLMNAIKFLILFLILIIPSTLIGATFPILSRFFIEIF